MMSIGQVTEIARMSDLQFVSADNARAENQIIFERSAFATAPDWE